MNTSYDYESKYWWHYLDGIHCVPTLLSTTLVDVKTMVYELQQAITLGQKQVKIEGASQQVVNLLNSRSSLYPRIRFTINDFNFLNHVMHFHIYCTH